MVIIDKIFDAFKDMIINWTQENLIGLFETINREVASVHSDLSPTPDSWNSSLWGMATNIGDTVIKPVAGIILACFTCLEIVTLMNDKNNLHSSTDVTATFIRFLAKLAIVLYVIQNADTITTVFFKVGAFLVNQANGYITDSTTLNPDLSAGLAVDSLKDESFFEVSKMFALVLLERFALFVISLIIRAAIIGRMLEIYLYCSLAPFPLATFANSGELSGIGKNYLKTLGALALQGFIMMLCVGFYAALINDISSADDLKATLFKLLVCAGVLTLSFIKSGTTAKSILTAH